MTNFKFLVINKLYGFLNYLRLCYFKIRYKTYRLKYNIDPSFKFNGIDIEFYGDGEIIIGKNSYVGNRTALAAVKGQKIVISDNCSISHNVRIYTSNRNPMDVIAGNYEIGLKNGDVIIGENCWIGANVFINQGITIGNNVVIGANSVVTKSFQSNVIIAGCPAKIIKLYEK